MKINHIGARKVGVSTMDSVGETIYALLNGRPAPRETIYRGTTFRSRLEVRFAWHLDALGVTWEYEPAVYGRPGEGYLPDFRVTSDNGPTTFIEVKPTLEEAPLARRRMEVIWDTHPDAVLVVAVAESLTFYAAGLGRPWVAWRERWAA